MGDQTGEGETREEEPEMVRDGLGAKALRRCS